MITLHAVDPYSTLCVDVLYMLLKERTPEQSISHKKLPSYADHVRFVKSLPYKAWCLIMENTTFVGSVYLSRRNELGIFLFKEHCGKGYAKEAISQLLMRYPGPPFYANVNPLNHPSQKLFIELGFELIQQTYAFGVDDAE